MWTTDFTLRKQRETVVLFLNRLVSRMIGAYLLAMASS